VVAGVEAAVDSPDGAMPRSSRYTAPATISRAATPIPSQRRKGDLDKYPS